MVKREPSSLGMEAFADALHDAEVIRQVVDGVERAGKRFAGLHQVAQISARIAAADHAVAIGVGRPLVFGIAFAFDVQPAFAGEEQAVAGGAGGQHAVHHVHAHAGVLLNLVGVADAHDVARLVLGQQRQDLGDHLQGQVAGLADAEAADGVAVKIHFNETLGALAAEVAVHAALHDTEEGLRAAAQLIVPRDFMPMGAEAIQRALCPGHGQPQAFLGSSPVGGVFGALVEGHGDVGAKGDLHVHGVLGGEEVAAAVQVRAETDALVGDLAELAEREDLKAAGIREQGARPTDEFVQAAHAADGLVTGAQVEVVRVAENDFGAEGFKRVLGDGLDGAGGADGHEDRRLDGPVGQMELGAASAGLGFREDVEGQGHPLILWATRQQVSRSASQRASGG